MRHTFECHSNEPNFKFACCHCHQGFSNYSSMTSHLSRKHRFTAEAPDHDSTASETNQLQTQSDLDLDPVLEATDSNRSDTTAAVSCHYLAQKSAALFLLTLKEKYKLTQTALDFAVGQVKHMLSFALDDMKDVLRQEIASGGNLGKTVVVCTCLM